jgi:UDP-N-acetylmuramoyl-L-alanyl-D-glutamate--2,6-diaminopimelate ligase
LTNVTHEHLDYHGTLEQYRHDKMRLFTMLTEKQKNLPTAAKYAIVNADDPYHRMFLNAAPDYAQQLTYGLTTRANIHASNIVTTPDGSHMHITTPWGSSDLSLQLPGIFNVFNALATLSVALSQQIPLTEACTALSEIRSIRGRMERIEQGQPFTVIVDYAHNPDSFTQVMEMMRALATGRLIAVFGSAGERDVEKRAQQGAIAARSCALLILTDEDPRGEDREAIIADIARGAEEAGKTRGKGYLVIPDRAAAIRTAIEHAAPGDVVLLLGKGHEGSIEYAEGKVPWDEAAEARAALRAAGYTGSE